MNKIFTAALVTVIFLGGKNADAVQTKLVARANGVELVLRGFVPVGAGVVPELIQATLTAVATEPDTVLTSFSGEIGSNGTLHHEQFIGGPPFFLPLATPTLDIAAESSVDSHFLVSTGSVVNAPTEQTGASSDNDDFVGIPSGEPGDFDAGEFVGFGPSLSGDFAFGGQDFGKSVDITYLVAINLSWVGFQDLVIGASETERAADFGSGEFVFGFVPEPSSGLLLMMGLSVGVAGTQRGRR